MISAMHGLLSLQLLATIACLSICVGKVDGFQPSSPKHHLRLSTNKHYDLNRYQQTTTCLHVIRRPLRPASTEKKRAERKANIESRQNEALQDPTLLTNQSFSTFVNINDELGNLLYRGEHYASTAVGRSTVSARTATIGVAR